MVSSASQFSAAADAFRCFLDTFIHILFVKTQPGLGGAAILRVIF